jgi:hypothetical protein
MNKILGCWVIAVAALAPASVAAASDRWIHVRVDDAGDERARVDIQVPVGLVSTLLPALNGRHGGGTIRVDGSHADLAELRSCWNAVRAAKDGDYVTVRDHDSNVRVSKSNGFLLMSVDDRGGRGRVRLKMPLPLVDAVLASGDTVDLEAVGSALEKTAVGDLLTVDDEDSHVRVWIDTAAAPAREDRP